jgi:hypothetical protein
MARDWLVATFRSHGLKTALQEFALEGQTSFNVIAELPGRTRPQDVVIVGAHFDSTSQDAWNHAPGAEDNASGVAALVEMARIFADHPPEATLRLIAFSGEEQGLVGSSAYASGLDATELGRIQGVLIMDMIGYTSDETLDVLLETYAWAEPLRAVLRNAAHQWTSLATYEANDPFGSDHMPFLRRGLPTVLLIQNEWDNYDCYHNTCDLPGELSKSQGREMMRMLAGALAELAGACHRSDGNCDGFVTVADVQAVAAHWNTNSSQPDFDVRRDLDHDGDVDLEDVLLAAADWGWAY